MQRNTRKTTKLFLNPAFTIMHMNIHITIEKAIMKWIIIKFYIIL